MDIQYFFFVNFDKIYPEEKMGEGRNLEFVFSHPLLNFFSHSSMIHRLAIATFRIRSFQGSSLKPGAAAEAFKRGRQVRFGLTK